MTPKFSFVPQAMHLAVRSYPYMKNFVFTAVLFYLFLMMALTYDLLQKFTPEFVPQYLRIYACGIFGITTSLLYTFLSKMFTENYLWIDMFTSTITTEVGELTRKKIDRLGRRTETWVTISIFCPILSVASLFYGWWQVTNSELKILTNLVKNLISEDLIVEQLFLCWIVVIMIFIMVPCILVFCYYLYIVVIVIVQILILIDKVKLELQRSNEKIVMEHIRDWSMAHLRIKRFMAEFSEQIEQLFFLYAFGGLIVGTGSVYSIYSPEFYVRDGVLFLSCYATYIYCSCTFGQYYIDSFTDLAYALYDLQWYSWSPVCQKSFLILFTNILQGDCLNFFLLFDINHEMTKKFARVTYITGNYFYSVQAKNS